MAQSLKLPRVDVLKPAYRHGLRDLCLDNFTKGKEGAGYIVGALFWPWGISFFYTWTWSLEKGALLDNNASLLSLGFSQNSLLPGRPQSLLLLETAAGPLWAMLPVYNRVCSNEVQYADGLRTITASPFNSLVLNSTLQTQCRRIIQS